MLWGSESWTLTVAEKLKFRGVERSMLRRFAGPRRAPEEEWLTWIKRATKAAVQAADKAGIKSWVYQHARVKWNWAGHVARMEEAVVTDLRLHLGSLPLRGADVLASQGVSPTDLLRASYVPP